MLPKVDPLLKKISVFNAAKLIDYQCDTGVGHKQLQRRETLQAAIWPLEPIARLLFAPKGPNSTLYNAGNPITFDRRKDLRHTKRHLNGGILDGNPTRMKYRANAWEKCSRKGEASRQRLPNC